MSSCCSTPEPKKSCCESGDTNHHSTGNACCESAAMTSACCPPVSEPSESDCCGPAKKTDWLLWGSFTFVAAAYALYLVPINLEGIPWLHHLAMSVFELMNTMWWGIVLGFVMVALIGRVPREFIMSALGTKSGFKGILRATGAGVLLDLCSHGILMVGAKLYERGASNGQVVSFLVASPWNSFSLTLILWALIGLPLTLAFIVLSMLIAVITGAVFDYFTSRGTLPANPNQIDIPDDFKFWSSAKTQFRKTQFNNEWWKAAIEDGISSSRMVIRWLLFGVMLASLIRAFVPIEVFQDYFGASLIGLMLTMVAATIIEVCSEGSTPIAADLVTRASAPGNGFAFLMTGVSTDYTEIMVLKDTTRSWRFALFLPLITLPQVVVLSLFLNSI